VNAKKYLQQQKACEAKVIIAHKLKKAFNRNKQRFQVQIE